MPQPIIRILESDLRSSLHRMWWCVRLLRSYNKNRDAMACGVQFHKFIFDRMIETFVYYLIVQVCALTDPNNKKGATFTTWLNLLNEKEKEEGGNPIHRRELIKIREEYIQFCKSPIYKGIRSRRNKSYAHIDHDRGHVHSLPGGKYGELFRCVEVLISIYDKLSLIGKARLSVWFGAPTKDIYCTISENIDMSPEDLMQDMMSALEKKHHDDGLHEMMNKESPTPM